MGLTEDVAAAFDPAGPLAAVVLEYRRRDGQLCMAQAVAEVMEQGGMLLVEAGTGVGKTYAYLVPALLSGKRVLVSTATKALQDQLFGRDIPQLRQLLGLPLRVALLKGRSSYLCLNRLESARQDWRLDERLAAQHLARIESWAHATQTGDMAEVDALDDSSALMPLVTSTRDNCLGARCPQASSCFVNRARREALGADLVVINHHLFFADLNVRESGVAELLPSVHAVVFDEAHQLNEIGVQFLGHQLGTAQLSHFVRDLEATAQTHARGLAPWADLAATLEHCAEALRARFPASERVQRLDWLAAGARWAELLEAALQAQDRIQAALALVAEAAPELQLLQSRGQALRELLHLFLLPLPEDAVRWLEQGRQLRMLQSPLDVSHAMQTRVLPAADASGGHKSWVFTSATLGHDADLSWMVQSCGLAGARVLKVPSPFDYAQQAALYVPKDFPKPAEAGHSDAVAALALRGALCLGGRTLVLTTTLRAMRSIGDSLARELQGRDDLQVLVQGAMPKRELLARFLEAGAWAEGQLARPGAGPGPCGAILVASATFWEGIDMPGAALQLLVIDKLPFTPPDDPVLQARSKALEAQGQSAFKHLHLPQTAVALRQGAGRLIRRESDQGVLVVCDVRLNQMGYGRQLLAALPAMRRLSSDAEFAAALESLTRPSTTVHPESSLPW
jgi:ATP-dependent DNA helicase DinG